MTGARQQRSIEWLGFLAKLARAGHDLALAQARMAERAEKQALARLIAAEAELFQAEHLALLERTEEIAA